MKGLGLGLGLVRVRFENQIIEEIVTRTCIVHTLDFVCCCVCDGVLSTALCDPTWSLNGGGTPSRKLHLGVKESTMSNTA